MGPTSPGNHPDFARTAVEPIVKKSRRLAKSGPIDSASVGPFSYRRVPTSFGSTGKGSERPGSGHTPLRTLHPPQAVALVRRITLR